MTDEKMAIVKALKQRPMTESELKAATGLKSLWPHRIDLAQSDLVRHVTYADWPDDDNKLYYLV